MNCDENNIEAIALRICDGIAGAIETYARLSGDNPAETMPEHFLHSFVLMTLGMRTTFTLTMETLAEHLWDWNEHTRLKGEKLPGAGPLPPPPEYKAEVGGWHADLVILSRLDEEAKADFVSLVEFKKQHGSQADVEKLETWLGWLDTCPNGIACGFVTEQYGLDALRNQAQADGHRFVSGPVACPSWNKQRFQTFAEILSNPKYQPPTER